ncbi:MAG: rRNA pseudouridine synthase [Deltaproteobacteria bacterium]|jgi:23S rRNA pseudouridine2605 synthase/23S rRNA pseudouridine2604 synthase|nr:rRNA pseudouridine synthase [Deltaproteobacteria bacterium]
MTLMRIQKYLSAAGVCSRRKGEELILAGRVSVNGAVVTELGTKANPDLDLVEVDGKAVHIEQERVYIVLNKPREYVTSTRHRGEPVVTDLVDLPRRIYPVGRLDKDSTGLLLLTNDGRLHHRLSHPSFDHEKEYVVRVARPIPDGALERLARGVPMMGTRTRPAHIKRISRKQFNIVLQEGKNKQIRRMVRKVGNHVTELQRIRIANIKLGKLAEGAWRHLTKKELEPLLKSL